MIRWQSLQYPAIGVLFMMICVSVQGQSITLTEALNYSADNYPLIRARQAEVSSAGQDVKVSSSAYIPRVSVQHQYTYGTSNSVTGSFYPNGGTVINPSGGIRPDNVYEATFGSLTSALLEWNVINFGKVSTSVKAARASLTSYQAVYEQELFQHRVRVADAYLLSLIGIKLKDIQEVNYDRAMDFWKIVEAGVRTGMRPGVDSALAHAEYMKARMLFLESERNEKAQQYRLLELMGMKDDALPTPDSMKFYSALPLSSDTGSTNWQLHPLLRYYQTRLDVSQAKAKSIQRSLLPSISLVAAGWARGSGVSNADDSFQTDFSSGTKYQVYNYMFGVSTRWTLTDFATVHYQYKSERYRADRDQQLYDEQFIKTQRQWRESEMQYSVALEQARLAPVQWVAAQQAYNQANARYQSGLTDLPTLLQSLITLNRAEADMAIAYSNAWRSLLMVAAAKGDMTLFLQAVQQ